MDLIVEYKEQENSVQTKDKASEDNQRMELEFHRDHPKVLIIGLPTKGVMIRSQALNTDSHWTFLSSIEPNNFKQTEKESCMLAM